MFLTQARLLRALAFTSVGWFTCRKRNLKAEFALKPFSNL